MHEIHDFAWVYTANRGRMFPGGTEHSQSLAVQRHATPSLIN